MSGSTHEVSVGFNVNFTHGSLTNYKRLGPDHEYAVRETYERGLFGDKQVEFDALFAAKRPIIGEALRGHIGGSEAHRIAREAVQAYNSLSTGTELMEPHAEPHCIRYEYFNGKRCVIYNYMTAVMAATNPPPPGGSYHVIICSEDEA